MEYYLTREEAIKKAKRDLHIFEKEGYTPSIVEDVKAKVIEIQGYLCGRKDILTYFFYK